MGWCGCNVYSGIAQLVTACGCVPRKVNGALIRGAPDTGQAHDKGLLCIQAGHAPRGSCESHHITCLCPQTTAA